MNRSGSSLVENTEVTPSWKCAVRYVNDAFSNATLRCMSHEHCFQVPATTRTGKAQIPPKARQALGPTLPVSTNNQSLIYATSSIDSDAPTSDGQTGSSSATGGPRTYRPAPHRPRPRPRAPPRSQYTGRRTSHEHSPRTTRRRHAHLMLVPRHIGGGELREVVLYEHREDALLKRVVVADDVTDICMFQLVCYLCIAERNQPFKTSLICPGGDWRRNWEAAVICSMMIVVTESTSVSLRVSRTRACRIPSLPPTGPRMHLLVNQSPHPLARLHISTALKLSWPLPLALQTSGKARSQ